MPAINHFHTTPPIKRGTPERKKPIKVEAINYLVITQIQVSQLIQQIIQLRVDVLQTTSATFQHFQILHEKWE
jgi:hypothetical protein